MGMDMTYVVGRKQEFSFCLSPAEIEILEALSQKSLKKEVEAIFGVSDFEGTSRIDKIMLLRSVERLLEAIKNKPEILPYTYRLEHKVSSNIGMLRAVCEMVSGVRINKELYSVRSGLDMCDLIKECQDKSGNWHDGERKDIRHLKCIKTDNMGEILIRKRKKPTKLVVNLEQLKSFLTKTGVAVVQKVLG